MSFTPHQIKADLDAHGELHCQLEEHTDELELRLGQVTFERNATSEHTGVFVVTSHGETWTFHVDRIVSYYLPESIWH
jgi:hypothetical protein